MEGQERKTYKRTYRRTYKRTYKRRYKRRCGRGNKIAYRIEYRIMYRKAYRITYRIAYRITYKKSDTRDKRLVREWTLENLADFFGSLILRGRTSARNEIIKKSVRSVRIRVEQRIECGYV